jgi:hypothetical protein
MGDEYPSGKCEYCGMIFERPHKFRTEPEAFHVYGCRLDGIERAIKNKEDLGIVEELIDEVKRIKKVSSFVATTNPENKYYKRMGRCQKIIDKLEEGS